MHRIGGTCRPFRLARFILLLVALDGGGNTALAQTRTGNAPLRADDQARRRSPIAIHRLTGAVELDGIVNEPVWSEVEPLPLALHTPTFLGPLTERTEVRIAHDDRYFYVAGKMYDSDPSNIRTNTFYRDVYSGDDLLAVVIDSYNDYETAVWFVTNPAGARIDRTVSNDGIGDTAMNPDWNAHWEVATSQNPEGWYAEFRIPFSTLRFQVVNGEVVMGLIVYRYIPRKNERQTFPALDPAWGGIAFAKPSQAQRVVLREVHQSKPVYVTPYALAGMRQLPTLPEPATTWRTDFVPTGELGADVRYSPLSNLALDLSINTDFAQVEADDQQINLTRFPLFFPEKRQFFQERASTFQFNTGGFTDRLFHSRRIGLDAGEIVRIYGGARAVGRIRGVDYGFLNMQTAPHDGRPSENMAVLRLQQQILNTYSSVGAMLTSRLGSGRGNNVAYGADVVLRPFGDEWITVKWAQSFDAAIAERSAFAAGLIQARWERLRDAGFSYAGEFLRVGGDYFPGLGFQARRGVHYVGGRLQYKRFQGTQSRLRAAGVQLGTGHYIRTSDGTAETRFVEPELELEFKDGTELSVGMRSSYESVRDTFAVADAAVLPGNYWFHEGRLFLMLPRGDVFRGEYSATAGTFYDGTLLSLNVNPLWNPSKYLELGAGYGLNRIVFSQRDTATTAHLARLKVQVALNTRISFNTLAQFSNVADLATFNARFRYHFREGTDLWVVYNEGVNTERDVAAQPRLPVSAGRTLMIKYTHTLIW